MRFLLFSLSSFFVAALGAFFYFKGDVNFTFGDNFNTANANSRTSALTVDDAFKIAVFADIGDAARQIATAADGWLFVGTRADKVYAAHDANNDGAADEVRIIAQNLKSPHGVFYHNGDLYIGEISTIYKVNDILSQLANKSAGATVALLPFITGLPGSGHHGMRHIEIFDGHLYVSYGVPCNICLPGDDELDAVIRRYPIGESSAAPPLPQDAKDGEVVARGIRNSVGFDFHPITGEMWFTDNGRDWMGDELPHDELNRVSHIGEHFGFPYCHQGDLLDPEFGAAGDCAKYTAPVLRTGPHVANLGMAFSPAGDSVFIALHGSWNRSEKIGYALWQADIAVDFQSVANYRPFVSGWLRGGEVSGRPVDVAVDARGDIFLSDDFAGLIYKITAKPDA